MSKQALKEIIADNAVVWQSEAEKVAQAILDAGWTAPVVPEPELVIFGTGDIVRSRITGSLFALGETHFMRLTGSTWSMAQGGVVEYGGAFRAKDGFRSDEFEKVEVAA